VLDRGSADVDFREGRLEELQLPNNLDQNPRLCAPSSATPALDRGSALSASSVDVSGAPGASTGASMAGILEVRAAMMRLFSRLASRS
jgi:hypothetical protein